MSLDRTTNTEELFLKIARLIDESRAKVAVSINLAEVYTKYRIGQYIVEEEQQGEERARYGQQVLQTLSSKLTERFGNGWSYSNLRQIRQFYLVYSDLTAAGCQIQNGSDSTLNLRASEGSSHVPNFTLSWSHYLILMRVENTDARRFYEIKCVQQQWSKRQLSRQVGSSLYERLALSRDKDSVIRLGQEGQVIEKPADLITDPITLEFLGLKSDSVYSESKLGKAENYNLFAYMFFLLYLCCVI